MKKKIFFNLSIDDPHPETSDFIADCGGDKEGGVFQYIIRLIEKFPDIKTTLFVTPNWIDKPNDPKILMGMKMLIGADYTHHWEGDPFRLDAHRDWCLWLNSYVDKGFIEVAIHGLYHHKKLYRFHSAEFTGLSYDESIRRLNEAEDIFTKSGLKFVRGFRPPGWGVSEGLSRALSDLQYNFTSFYPEQKNIYVKDGVVYLPQTWGINESVSLGVESAYTYGYVFAKGHMSPAYGRDISRNGLTEENYQNMIELLNILKEDFDVEFLSMEEISRRYKEHLFT